MRLSVAVMEGIKSVLSHNAAQKLLQDKQQSIAYLLNTEFELVQMGVDADQIHTLITFARMKSRAEVKTLKDMYLRYGIDPTVSGHGGSELNIETIITMAQAREGEL